MMNAKTMLVHIRGWARDFLSQCQDENGARKVRYIDEIFWGVSSTITIDSFHLRSLVLDRIFYTIQAYLFGFRYNYKSH